MTRFKKIFTIFFIVSLAVAVFNAPCSGSKEAESKDKVYELKLGHVAEPDNPMPLEQQNSRNLWKKGLTVKSRSVFSRAASLATRKSLLKVLFSEVLILL